MKEIAIPLFIPLKNNEIDYQSLKNLINEINDYNNLIGDYNLNNLIDEDYLNVYLYFILFKIVIKIIIFNKKEL